MGFLEIPVGMTSVEHYRAKLEKLIAEIDNKKALNKAFLYGAGDQPDKRFFSASFVPYYP